MARYKERNAHIEQTDNHQVSLTMMKYNILLLSNLYLHFKVV